MRQGFIANAWVSAKSSAASANFLFELAGILYQSYQARGYLQFLGQQAKQGTLKEEHLPLMGWPRAALLQSRRSLSTEGALTLGVILACVILSVSFIGLVRSQGNDVESTKG